MTVVLSSVECWVYTTDVIMSWTTLYGAARTDARDVDEIPRVTAWKLSIGVGGG